MGVGMGVGVGVGVGVRTNFLKFLAYTADATALFAPLSRRQFFETLYGMLIAVLDESFQHLNKKEDIEREVGVMETLRGRCNAMCSSVQKILPEI